MRSQTRVPFEREKWLDRAFNERAREVFWSFSEPHWSVVWGASRGVIGRFGDREGRSYYFFRDGMISERLMKSVTIGQTSNPKNSNATGVDVFMISNGRLYSYYIRYFPH